MARGPLLAGAMIQSIVSGNDVVGPIGALDVEPFLENGMVCQLLLWEDKSFVLADESGFRP
ncbi:hypothetical protein N7492_009524 [Penicillium capsulatum]|uniref:Uncharacterized protein n=1 Tax=Penicillium capsulatum TaxID=69766 RepID=A0A9W9HSN2_9EURO|nr:hypothetical protein N7492_009524 [Penicillium capsulatum]